MAVPVVSGLTEKRTAMLPATGAVRRALTMPYEARALPVSRRARKPQSTVVMLLMDTSSQEDDDCTAPTVPFSALLGGQLTATTLPKETSFAPLETLSAESRANESSPLASAMMEPMVTPFTPLTCTARNGIALSPVFTSAG